MPIIRPNRDPRRKCAWIADFTPAATGANPYPTRVRPGFLTLEEAEIAVALAGDDACLPLRARMCVGTVVAWYLEFERKRMVSETTVCGYGRVLDRLLTPELRARPFRSLTPADLAVVLVPRRGDSLSSKTKDEYARIVGRMMTAAIVGWFADVDIAAAFVRQHAVKRKARLRSLPDGTVVKDMRGVASPVALAVFELETSLFPGPETVARMIWRDVDFGKGTVFLPDAPIPGVADRRGRTRVMGDRLHLALLRWRALSFACAPDDPLFVSPDGLPLAPHDVNELIHAAQIRAGYVAVSRRSDGAGKVQGMPRGKYAPGDFKVAAIREIAATLTSLKALARRVNRDSTEALQPYRRFLRKSPGHRRPMATLRLVT